MTDTRDTSCGRMSPERSAPTKEKISAQSSKRCAESKKKYQFLDLRSGNQQAKSWETVILSPGEHSTRNIGEYPKEENASTLSQILQRGVQEKYYLTPRACLGILRRASERGKELHEILKAALLAQSRGMAESKREP